MSYLSQFLGAGSVLRVTSYTSGFGTFSPLVANSRALVFLTGGGNSGSAGLYGVNSPSQYAPNPTSGAGGGAGITVIFCISVTGNIDYFVGGGGVASASANNPGGNSTFGQQTSASTSALSIINSANCGSGARTSFFDGSGWQPAYAGTGIGGRGSYYGIGGSGGNGGLSSYDPSVSTSLCANGTVGATGNTPVAGGAGTGYGAGGGGGGKNNEATAGANGGAGAGGYIEIWEYGV